MHNGKFLTARNIQFTIITAVALLLFAFLVVKQIERDAERGEIQATLETRSKQPPVQIVDLESDASELNFRRVKVQGVFEQQYSFLLDSAVEIGQAGYYVISPFRIAGTQTRVLVNRGWIPLSKNQNSLPAINVPTNEMELRGIVELPRVRRTVLGPIEPINDSWQELWPYLDVEYFSKIVPYNVQPFVVLQEGDSSHGYIRQWSAYITRK